MYKDKVKYYNVTMVVRNAYDKEAKVKILTRFLALHIDEPLEETLHMMLGGQGDILNYTTEPVAPREVYISPDYCKERLKY